MFIQNIQYTNYSLYLSKYYLGIYIVSYLGIYIVSDLYMFIQNIQYTNYLGIYIVSYQKLNPISQNNVVVQHNFN